MKRETKVLMLPGAHSSPSARFRMLELIEPLRNAGLQIECCIPTPDRTGRNAQGEVINTSRFSRRVGQIKRFLMVMKAVRNAGDFDLVFANRDIVPELAVRLPERYLFNRGIPLVFDFDDAIHLGPREPKVGWILQRASWATPGNATLAEFARRHCEDVTVVPTVVNTDHYTPDDDRTPGRVRVGWSGSESTNRVCLPILERPICELARKHDFEFVVISNEDPRLDWPGVRVKFISWAAESEVRDLRLLDIGTMPLKDSPFERGKCGLKAIQYMALGIPAVVSPVGVNREIVRDGDNGFFANEVEDWVRCISALVSDEGLRDSMGRAARTTVKEHYSHKTAVDLLSAGFSRVLRRTAR